MKSSLSKAVLVKRIIYSTTLALSTSILSTFPTMANAWTDNLESIKDLNTLCKFEPETQCTSAVRIGVDLAGVDMHHASMTTMRLDKANLQGANLSHAILQLSNFKEANMMFANLEGAHMHATNLQKTNLMMANMQKVNLLDADLRGANLQGANLQGAILIQAKLGDAIWIDGRKCATDSVGTCK
jgi:uncharacterized protein YjbI with pentapeptide repeats